MCPEIARKAHPPEPRGCRALLPDQLPGSIGAAIIDQQAAKLDVRMRYENPIDGIDKSIEGFLFIEQRSENAAVRLSKRCLRIRA